jgi:hypothetical protein
MSFTPFAVVLFGIALLLLLVGLAAGRGHRRWLCDVAAVLVLPMLGLHL